MAPVPERVKGRELPAWTRRRPGCGPTSRSTSCPGSCTATTSSPTSCTHHGAPARLAAIVDWEMGTIGDPKLDLAWVVARWPEDTDSPEPRVLRRPHGDAGRARRSCSATARSPAARSTTSTTTWCSPGGSWPSCSSRASSGRPATPKMAALGTYVLDLLQGGRRAGGDLRLPGLTGGNTTDATGQSCPAERVLKLDVPLTAPPRSQRPTSTTTTRTIRHPRSAGCAWSATAVASTTASWRPAPTCARTRRPCWTTTSRSSARSAGDLVPLQPSLRRRVRPPLRRRRARPFVQRV